MQAIGRERERERERDVVESIVYAHRAPVGMPRIRYRFDGSGVVDVLALCGRLRSGTESLPRDYLKRQQRDRLSIV